MNKTNLYLVDNGACYCADHLGATAKATGRDISGQPIHKMTIDDIREMIAMGCEPKCERCGAKVTPT